MAAPGAPGSSKPFTVFLTHPMTPEDETMSRSLMSAPAMLKAQLAYVYVTADTRHTMPWQVTQGGTPCILDGARKVMTSSPKEAFGVMDGLIRQAFTLERGQQARKMDAIARAGAIAPPDPRMGYGASPAPGPAPGPAPAYPTSMGHYTGERARMPEQVMDPRFTPGGVPAYATTGAPPPPDPYRPPSSSAPGAVPAPSTPGAAGTMITGGAGVAGSAFGMGAGPMAGLGVTPPPPGTTAEQANRALWDQFGALAIQGPATGGRRAALPTALSETDVGPRVTETSLEAVRAAREQQEARLADAARHRGGGSTVLTPLEDVRDPVRLSGGGGFGGYPGQGGAPPGYGVAGGYGGPPPAPGGGYAPTFGGGGYAPPAPGAPAPYSGGGGSYAPTFGGGGYAPTFGGGGGGQQGGGQPYSAMSAAALLAGPIGPPIQENTKPAMADMGSTWRPGVSGMPPSGTPPGVAPHFPGQHPGMRHF